MKTFQSTPANAEAAESVDASPHTIGASPHSPADRCAPRRSAEGRQQTVGKVLIIHCGNRYVTPVDRAKVFLIQAQRLINANGEELIPLQHDDGLELLLVSSSTPLFIGSCEPASPERRQSAPRRSEPQQQAPG